MIIRSKAPLRLGLAGGGTDVSPYSDIYGGAILNATISLYANASLEPLDNARIEFVALDRDEKISFDSADFLEVGKMLPLHIGVYNRIVKEFSKKPLSFRLSTFVDAPAGSGLGTSSTLMVAILGAFGWGTFAAAIVPVVVIGFNWKRATPMAANIAVISSLVVNFVIKIFKISVPYNIDVGALALTVSLILFIGISLASEKPELDPDVEAVMDL